jgi:hypothetical protein
LHHHFNDNPALRPSAEHRVDGRQALVKAHIDNAAAVKASKRYQETLKQARLPKPQRLEIDQVTVFGH